MKASIASGCSKRPSSKAAASEEARRTRRYVELLREARTPLAAFFSILLAVEFLQPVAGALDTNVSVGSIVLFREIVAKRRCRFLVQSLLCQDLS